MSELFNRLELRKMFQAVYCLEIPLARRHFASETLFNDTFWQNGGVKCMGQIEELERELESIKYQVGQIQLGLSRATHAVVDIKEEQKKLQQMQAQMQSPMQSQPQLQPNM
ncbi:MAG: hypothetical protein K6A61_09155, partial [Butyrivibrio sp.]|nr:hypothetical protein [Butyrivibrio sp.]